MVSKLTYTEDEEDLFEINEFFQYKIQIYARRIRAFGKDVDALRIRDFLPKPKSVDPTKAIEAINACNSLEQLKKTYTSLTKDMQGHPDVIKAKDARKEVVK